jgi:AcrR family transcriptional regulator
VRVKTEERRQSIIDAAAKVFREEGFDRASMSEIAKRLGGSKATLYSYFTSKEELYTSVMRQSPEVGELFGPFSDPNLDVPTVADLRAQLERFAVAYLRFHMTPDILAMRRNMIAQGERSDVGRLAFEAGPRHNFVKLAEHLERAMQRGLIRQEVPWIALQHLLGLIESELITARLLGLIKNVPQEVIRAAALRGVDVYLRAYAVEETKSARKKEHAHS